MTPLLYILAISLIVSILILFYVATPKKEGFTKNNAKTLDEAIDVIYYINLDHRTDRREQFLEEMKLLQIPETKLVRISAVYEKSRGDLGCSKSHIKTLQLFLESPHQHCIIFEDDFKWIESAETVNKLFSKMVKKQVDYDVCMLSAGEVGIEDSEYDFLKKVTEAQTTSGYMVNKQFAATLLQNFIEGAALLEESYEKGAPNGPIYCVDQYWKRLQPMHHWYLFSPKLGMQRDSYSDIQGGFVEMSV